MGAGILYVDDDDANLTVFMAVCGSELPCHTASSGAEALEVMRHRDIAVLLTDQRMPGMTGVELAEKAHAEFPDTVRMLITAYTELSVAIEAINRGHIRRYLRKPWDGRELRAALHEALDLYQTRLRAREMERRLLATERVYALGVVAAGIGHELRNPVGWIASNLAVVRSGLQESRVRLAAPGVDPKLVADQLGDLEEAVADAIEGMGRIKEIAAGIELSTRRSEEGEPVDLAEVVRLTLRGVQGELRRRAQVELDTHAVPMVRGSRTRLGQVVLNLVVNALEALPDRPRAENLIRIRLMQRPQSVRLEVEDNGTGITPEALAKIFDPFYTTKEKSGTGLGLAISRRIVEELGGKIEVERAEKGGVRFSVTLPALSAG